MVRGVKVSPCTMRSSRGGRTHSSVSGGLGRPFQRRKLQFPSIEGAYCQGLPLAIGLAPHTRLGSPRIWRGFYPRTGKVVVPPGPYRKAGVRWTTSRPNPRDGRVAYDRATPYVKHPPGGGVPTTTSRLQEPRAMQRGNIAGHSATDVPEICDPWARVKAKRVGRRYTTRRPPAREEMTMPVFLRR